MAHRSENAKHAAKIVELREESAIQDPEPDGADGAAEPDELEDDDPELEAEDDVELDEDDAA